MTELLEQAIAKLKTLPDDQQNSITRLVLKELEDEQQNAIAALILEILEELEDDRCWDEAFARSPDVLANLAAEAMAEYRAGSTQELDPETL